MVTVKFKKAYKHLSNEWKKGDTPTISNSLAKELKNKGVVEILDGLDISVVKQVIEEEE